MDYSYLTSWGRIRVEWEGERVKSIDLPLLSSAPSESPVLSPLDKTAEKEDFRAQVVMWRFLDDLFSKPVVHVPASVFPAGPAFHQKVWKALCAIPYGSTMTYGQLASVVGRPKAARAVGQACGANPLPLLIPCHRVIPKQGGLGGFSSGLPWKEWLLRKEGHVS